MTEIFECDCANKNEKVRDYIKKNFHKSLKFYDSLGLTEKRVQTAEMQKSAATIDVAGGLHSWPEY